MFGGIEAGGTKFVCGIGTSPEDLKTAQFQTRTPAETIPPVIDFFKQNAGVLLKAVGIGSFGPVDLQAASATFGHITSTPKLAWQNFDLAGAVHRGLDVPVGFDTDVGASLLGEKRWGAGRGLTDFIYLTFGTGVGGAAMVNDQLVHGLVHTEMGHIRLPHDFDRDPYAGYCTFHGDCLEGLTCGPAIEQRWGAPATSLPPDHAAWALEAHYVALALANLTFSYSPQRIIVGGGVMQQPDLFRLIRKEFVGLLNGYIRHGDVFDRVDQFIVPPQLGRRSGVLGALVLAQQVYRA